MEITAAVLRAKSGPYVLEPVELAEPQADEVLIRIVATGMCHTDSLPRDDVTLSPPPIITGHEGAGVVVATGSAVHSVAPGDHVVLSFDSCGECERCVAGQPAYCETMTARNMVGRRLDQSTGVTDASRAEVASRWFGQSSFATYAIATERNVVRVDPALPLAKLGPLGCGMQTGAATVLVALAVQPGASVVVFGVGAVGMASVMAAKVAGASTIIAVDVHDHRLQLARELGATHTINGGSGDPLVAILTLTSGGVRHAIDTTAVPSVMLTAIDCLKPGGSCAFVAYPTEALNIHPLRMAGKTVSFVVQGGANPQTFIPHMIELWQAGRFPFDRLIEEYPLDQINNAEADSMSGRVIKPVLLVSESAM